MDTDIRKFKEDLDTLINQHFDYEHLDNVFLARKLFLSEAAFYRMAKKAYGLTPNQLIRSIRLKKADEMLTTSRKTSVKEAAYAVGFSHVGYFIRRYEEFFGHRPGEQVNSQLSY